MLTKDGAIDFVGPGGAVAYHYTDLHAIDATGRELPGRMGATAGGVRLVVDARGASYPLVVDPLVWTSQRLTAPTDTRATNFGESLSVSGDLALVTSGSQEDGAVENGGAVDVFAKSGTTWTPQATLHAGGGALDPSFGAAVSFFTRSGPTWTQQAKLTSSAPRELDGFGTAVSLSGDTAVISTSPTDGSGWGADVFTRSGTTWTRQAKLVSSSTPGSSGGFGFSVSLSDRTVFVGAPFETDGVQAGGNGAIYAFGGLDTNGSSCSAEGTGGPVQASAGLGCDTSTSTGGAGGATGSGTASAGSGTENGELIVQGCACAAAGTEGGKTAYALGLGALALAVAARRRRSGNASASSSSTSASLSQTHYRESRAATNEKADVP